MVKSFRRIRQRLLTQKKPASPAGRYLLYSIGEIVLVVIGILIALQINSWNEDVKNRSLKASYLKALMIDLSKDTVEINRILTYMIEDSLSIAAHQIELTKKEASLENLLSIMVYDWNPRISTLRSFNTNSIEALVSTGNINLINPEVLNYLANLKRLQETYISASGPFIEFYRYVGNPAVSAPKHTNVINQGPIFEQMLEDVDKIALAYKFDRRLTIKRQAYRNSTRALQEILSETKTLIRVIEQKLE